MKNIYILSSLEGGIYLFLMFYKKMVRIVKILQIAIFIFSAQVGSGLFILPAALSTGGYKSMVILFFVGIICTIITHVFAKTGKNSSDLIKDAFGQKAGNYFFFIYWVISWFSTIVLFKELVGYVGFTGKSALCLETFIWGGVTLFNMWNFKHIVFMEGILTCIKILPFFGLIFCFFLKRELAPIIKTAEIDMALFLKCLWCFVGLEIGSIMSKSLNMTDMERKVGTYIGMFVVMIFYIGSVFFCFSVCGTKILYLNNSPYITVFQSSLYPYLSNEIISFVIKSLVVLVLVGSINSWTISSGYVAYEGGCIGILPKIFKKINKHNVPYMGVFISSVLVLIFILLTHNDNIYHATMRTIDISCCFFLLIYGMSLFSYGKVYDKNIYLKIFYLFLSSLILLCFVYSFYDFILK